MQNASTTMPRPRRRGGPRQHSQTVAGYSARSDTAACGIWLAATLIAGSIAAAAGVVPTYDNGIVGLETCQGNTGAGLTAGKKNAAGLSTRSTAKDRFVKRNPLNDPSRTVVVKILQKTLDLGIVKNKVREMTDDAAAHVQIFAVDKETGEIIDNFGFFNGPKPADGDSDARIRSESIDAYDQLPIGEYEMSLECYKKGRAATENELAGAEYRLYNKMGGLIGRDGHLDPEILDAAKTGLDEGRKIGEKAGFVGRTGIQRGAFLLGSAAAGTIGGVLAGLQRRALNYGKSYEARHTPEIIEDNARQMSFPGMNCHLAAELFLKHVNQDASFKENLKYTHPGERSAPKIDTSTLERLIERKLEIAQRILSRGKRVVDGDPLGRELNSVTREIMEELARVVQEAENRLRGLSTEEVEKIAQRDFARVFAMSGKLDGVVRELLERKLIAGYKRLDMPMPKKAKQ